ncbi:MAG: tetratricopeptide repeat protein [Myxococcota bacterium]|nr:tetratricopeptide repeat protein [Deltaproteobacteria bacterium]MDQ3334311.1 tetratricopeptide repeat protein [Myxococcota bacterium]
MGCGGGKEKATPVEKSETVVVKDVFEPDIDVEEKPIKKTEAVSEVAPLPKTYAEAFELGKALVDKGEHPRAREILEVAAKLEKKKADPHIELARSYIATSERANAIKSANKAVKLAPESSQAYNTLGRAELLRHNYENAIEAFRQSTELNEGNVWAWNNLGFTYLTLKKYDEAITALTEATSRKGAQGYMFNNLGTAYEHMDQLDEAREAFEKGGELGSVAATSSRKRLEGVDTIVVVVKDEPKVEVKPGEEMKVDVKEFEHSEPMPDPEIAPEVTEEPVVEEPKVEEPKVEESGVDAKVDVETKTEDVDDEFKGDDVAPVAPIL